MYLLCCFFSFQVSFGFVLICLISILLVLNKGNIDDKAAVCYLVLFSRRQFVRWLTMNKNDTTCDYIASKLILIHNLT